VRQQLRRHVALGLAVLVGSAMASCGKDQRSLPPAPVKVPVQLVPPTLANGKYTIREDTESRKAFTTAGPKALIADGRLWAIRDANGDKLVGALQISTMKPLVDLTRKGQRDNVVDHIMGGASETVGVGPLDVVRSRSEDKTISVWFGRDLFEVLQLKRSEKDPIDEEAILGELIGFQTTNPAWKALPGQGDVGSGIG
jgi:hypothetical protein